MSIFVLVKQVPDTETKIRIKADKSGIETNDVKWFINPYDEFAIEEALKTKDKIKSPTVTVLSLGPDRVVEALRTALAMGADNAIHIKTEGEVDTFTVGKAISEVLKKENATVVFAGKQAVDDDQAATFGFVAEFLGWPSVSVVTKIDWDASGTSLKAEREVEGGTKFIVQSSVPVCLAVDKGINTPRYASLPGIMKAKKKEIKGYALSDLGLSASSAKVKESDYQPPPERAPGKKLSGDAATQAHELVRLLREEAKVI